MTLKNYRLISLLPLVSKIIGKTIHVQTQEYLNKNGLLCKYQSGFRASFSADSCYMDSYELYFERISHWDGTR